MIESGSRREKTVSKLQELFPECDIAFLESIVDDIIAATREEIAKSFRDELAKSLRDIKKI